jgi:hypothetical protein
MGLSDIDARFDAVTTTPGTLAEVAKNAARTAAHEINNHAGPGESTDLMSVIQYLELSAQTAARYLNFPAEESDKEDPNTSGGYDDLLVADLKERLDDRELPTSGTKHELIERLREDDRRRADLDPVGNSGEQG